MLEVKPLCFVLMPFGKKLDGSGRLIDFDLVYSSLISPAIEKVGLEPLRADEEAVGGIIHKPMYERLILCEYAIADLTTANANVFYELGIRHAVRAWSTVLLFAKDASQLPFDVSLLRAIPYSLDASGQPSNLGGDIASLADRLEEAKKGAVDSPLHQLVQDYPDVDHTKTDVFRDLVNYSKDMKKKLAEARKIGLARLVDLEKEIEPVCDAESGVVIDLFLSYRGIKAWGEMISLAGKMSRPLLETVMVQEQLAFALNRAGRAEDAEAALLSLIDKRGASSETCGILGRVYKDRWERALQGGQLVLAEGLLDKAIDAYLQGFEADWRDAYPGINALTLMEIRNPPDERRADIYPVVLYSVERKMERGKPDYWDYATLLELAVIGNNERKARVALGNALAHARESWETESTARNLRVLREARAKRGEELRWQKEIEEELNK